MKRIPTLVLVAAMLAGLFMLERTRDPVEFEREVLVAGGPVSATEPGQASTWYCPAGFSTPDALNDHQIIITNRLAETGHGSLTLFPTLPDTLGNSVPFERARQPVEVPPESRVVVSLGPIVATLHDQLGSDTGSFVGAMAEFDTGGISVEHAIVTPAGSDIAACATSAAASWWFAGGTTASAVTYQLYLLNPFPDDAVVDVTFLTDDGARSPNAFDGRLVPAHSLSVLDISSVLPPWDQVTTEITTRTGRVIAERVQLFRDEAGPVGLSVTSGANQMSEQWFFPAGAAIGGVGESYVIYNPNAEPAEVEVEVKPDSANRDGDIAPLGVVMAPHERWVVNVGVHPTHPVETVATIDATTVVGLGERYFVSVRSFSGVPVVAERIVSRPIEAGQGVATSAGLTRASTDQTVAVPPWWSHEDPTADGELAVLNPAGNTIARVEIWVGGDESAVIREHAELAPRRRAAFKLRSLLRPGDTWIRVVSSTGTMTEMVAAAASQITAAPAIAAADTLSTPDLLFAFD